MNPIMNFLSVLFTLNPKPRNVKPKPWSTWFVFAVDSDSDEPDQTKNGQSILTVQGALQRAEDTYLE